MAGRPKKKAKQFEQFFDDFLALSHQFDELCPEAYRDRPPRDWDPHKESYPEWEEKHGAYYDANEMWFHWYEADRAISAMEDALMELSGAVERKAANLL